MILNLYHVLIKSYLTRVKVQLIISAGFNEIKVINGSKLLSAGLNKKEPQKIVFFGSFKLSGKPSEITSGHFRTLPVLIPQCWIDLRSLEVIFWSIEVAIVGQMTFETI